MHWMAHNKVFLHFFLRREDSVFVINCKKQWRLKIAKHWNQRDYIIAAVFEIFLLLKEIAGSPSNREWHQQKSPKSHMLHTKCENTHN